MENFNKETKPGHFNPEDKTQGKIIYFLGIIIVSVVSVGYLVLKGIGLL